MSNGTKVSSGIFCSRGTGETVLSLALGIYLKDMEELEAFNKCIALLASNSRMDVFAMEKIRPSQQSRQYQGLSNPVTRVSNGSGSDQGGRTWQPFVGSKNGNENFRQARIYNKGHDNI